MLPWVQARYDYSSYRRQNKSCNLVPSVTYASFSPVWTSEEIVLPRESKESQMLAQKGHLEALANILDEEGKMNEQ